MTPAPVIPATVAFAQYAILRALFPVAAVLAATRPTRPARVQR